MMLQAFRKVRSDKPEFLRQYSAIVLKIFLKIATEKSISRPDENKKVHDLMLEDRHVRIRHIYKLSLKMVSFITF